jgi:hypothetical protein
METTTDHPSICASCRAGLEHCHEVSVEHADGATECFDGDCTVPHWLHEWQVSCSAFDPPCPCIPEDAPAPWLVAAA